MVDSQCPDEYQSYMLLTLPTPTVNMYQGSKGLPITITVKETLAPAKSLKAVSMAVERGRLVVKAPKNACLISLTILFMNLKIALLSIRTQSGSSASDSALVQQTFTTIHPSSRLPC